MEVSGHMVPVRKLPGRESPDLAVINATRERVAASASGNETAPGPNTRNENTPATEGGHFLG